MSDVADQITNAMSQALSAQETPTPVVEAPPPVETAKPTAINLTDDALVSYKVGDKEFTKPWQEILKTQVLLPGDYTKKTQELAQQRKEFEAKQAEVSQWQTEKQQILAALQDPQKVGAIYLAALSRAQQQGQNPQQAQRTAQAAIDPNQILTAIDERLNAKFSEYQTGVLQSKIEQDMDSFVGGLRKGTPIEDLPGVDNYIYEQVEAMHPSSVEEAKQYAKTVFEDYLGKFSAKFTAAKKADEVAKDKLTKGIEPPGGTVVTPQARKYDGPKDPRMQEDMLNFMKQQLGL